MRDVILFGEYGSRAQGTANQFSDSDYMGVYIETPSQVLGVDGSDIDVKRDGSGPGGRSQVGDEDTTLYPLRKFASLVLKGNPTVASLLWLPEYKTKTYLGQRLVRNRDLFLSKAFGYAHQGYFRSQVSKLKQERNNRTNRPELTDQFGYDTKFAYHAVRLAMQGAQFMVRGYPDIPLEGYQRQTCLRIRAGVYSKGEVLTLIDELDYELDTYIKKSELPDKPDRDRVNRLLVELQMEAWEYTRD